MGFGNSGNYNGGYNGGGYNGGYNGGGYNGGNGYNNGYGGGRGSGGGLVCPQCGSTNCHAQLGKSGENLVMFDSARNTHGILGMLFSGFHMRKHSYDSFAVCNSCGYFWQVGKEKVGALTYLLRLIVDMPLATLCLFLAVWLGVGDGSVYGHPLLMLAGSLAGLGFFVDVWTGWLTNRFFGRFGR